MPHFTRAAFFALLMALVPTSSAAASCLATTLTAQIEAEAPNSAIFIGRPLRGEPLRVRADGVLKGVLPAVVELRVQTAEIPSLFPDRTYLISASTDERGALVVGPCHTVQIVSSREEARQLLTLAPEAQARSDFQHLPSVEPVTLAELASAGEAGDGPTSAPAPDQADASPTVAPIVFGGLGLAILLAVTGIGTAIWAIRTGRRARLWPAAASALAGIVLAAAVMPWSPAPETAAEPTIPPPASTSVEPSPAEPKPPLPEGEPTRDPVVLAERFESFGMGCWFEEDRADNWRRWECRDSPSADLWLEVAFSANTHRDAITSFSVSVRHLDGALLDALLAPADYEPFLRQALERPALDEVVSWLSGHWALTDISVDVSGIILGKGASAIGLDLRARPGT